MDKSEYCLWIRYWTVKRGGGGGGGGWSMLFLNLTFTGWNGGAKRPQKLWNQDTLWKIQKETSVGQLPSMTVRLPWVKTMYLLYETDITVLNTCQVKCVLCASSHVCTVYTLTRIHTRSHTCTHTHTHTHTLTHSQHTSRFIPEIKTWGHQQLWSVVYTLSVFSQGVDSVAVYRVKRKLHSMWTMLEGCLWWATLSLHIYIHIYIYNILNELGWSQVSILECVKGASWMYHSSYWASFDLTQDWCISLPFFFFFY